MNAPVAPSAPEAPLARIGDFPFAGELDAVADLYQTWKNRLLDAAADNPLETLVSVVLGSAWLLYQAEHETNEGFNTYDDALYYVSTCLSVGYANVFPKTQAGKFVAALVMMIGPSLSSWVVEGHLIRRGATQPAPAPVVAPAANSAEMTLVAEKLEELIQELRLQRGADPPPATA
jgi:hypothetical protein